MKLKKVIKDYRKIFPITDDDIIKHTRFIINKYGPELGDHIFEFDLSIYDLELMIKYIKLKQVDGILCENNKNCSDCDRLDCEVVIYKKNLKFIKRHLIVSRLIKLDKSKYEKIAKKKMEVFSNNNLFEY